MNQITPPWFPILLVAVIALLWQFSVQVAATLVALWIWSRMRGRRAR